MSLMKRLITFLLLSAIAVPALAQIQYGAYLDYYFDNREFDASEEKYMESQTLHSVRFTPTLGILLHSDEQTTHRLMIAADVFRDMGSRKKLKDSFEELTIYYDFRKALRNGRNLAIVAGVFPRRMTEGEYGEMIWSDSLRFYDPNLEGMLIKYGSPSFKAEIGCDWMGKYSLDIRERFQIFTSGAWTPRDWLILGWSGLFYHYATSGQAKNVIDNHLLYPYAQLDVSPWTGFFDEWSFRAAGLLSYQRARDIDPSPSFPVGGEFSMMMRKWRLALGNTVYTGDNIHHYFDYVSPEGSIYGYDLYPSAPYYRGYYFRNELSWQPRLSEFVSLRLSARFHFDESGFLGSQQMVSLFVTMRSAKKW